MCSGAEASALRSAADPTFSWVGVSRFPKYPRDNPGDGVPRGLRLVVAPDLRPSPRREFGFGSSLGLALISVALLAFVGSKWVLPALVIPPRVVSAPMIALENGEALEEVELLREPPKRLPVPAVPPAVASAAPVVTPEIVFEEDIVADPVEFVVASEPETIEPLFEEAPERAVAAPSRPKVSKPRPPQTNSRSRPQVVRNESARLTRRVAPVYPHSARRAGVEGQVTVLLTVGTDGRVSSATVHRSSGSKALDQAAVRASRKWRFSPATRAGKPVVTQLPAPFTFRLRD